MLFDTQEDGFGNLDFRRPEDRPGPDAVRTTSAAGRTGAAHVGRSGTFPAGRAETPRRGCGRQRLIAAEGLTSRQLRRAALIAQKHGLHVTSEFDAVRLLREAGVDPFSRASILRVVSSAPSGFGWPGTGGNQRPAGAACRGRT